MTVDTVLFWCPVSQHEVITAQSSHVPLPKASDTRMTTDNRLLQHQATGLRCKYWTCRIRQKGVCLCVFGVVTCLPRSAEHNWICQIALASHWFHQYPPTPRSQMAPSSSSSSSCWWCSSPPRWYSAAAAAASATGAPPPPSWWWWWWGRIRAAKQAPEATDLVASSPFSPPAEPTR